MNDTAQIIIAVGIACLLLAIGALGVIWSLRCSPKVPHYRLPAVIAVSIPLAASIAWALVKLG